MKRVVCVWLCVFLLVSLFSFSASADTTVSNPLHYLQEPYGQNLVVKWTISSSDSVTGFTVSLRELSVLGNATNILHLSNVPVASGARSYTISKSYLKKGGYYRFAFSTQLSNGNVQWIEKYIFVGISRGIKPGDILSFKIYSGFTQAEKDAVYYSTRSWIDETGLEKANTYSFDQSIQFDYLVSGDGINSVTNSTTLEMGAGHVMRAVVKYDGNGYVTEADIQVNRDCDFSFGAQVLHFDFQSVMTHEFGHVLGLADVYEDFASHWTMYYGSYMNSTNQASLYYYDIESVKHLYSVQT